MVAMVKPGMQTVGDKVLLPLMVAGREAVGRSVEVWRDVDLRWHKGTITDFDPASVKHKVHFQGPGSVCIEEWTCLGRARFSWASEVDPEHSSPTFQAELTPLREDAIGHRVKVYWTLMGRWYQGKVMEYDSASGQHVVKYADGDRKTHVLRQEAVVWLDVPALLAYARAQQAAGSRAYAPPAHTHSATLAKSVASRERLPLTDVDSSNLRRSGRASAARLPTRFSEPGWQMPLTLKAGSHDGELKEHSQHSGSSGLTAGHSTPAGSPVQASKPYSSLAIPQHRATSSSDTQADVGDVKSCGAEHDGKRFGDEQSAGSEQSQRSRQRTTSGSSGSHNNVQVPNCGPAGLRPQEISRAEDHTEAVSPSHPPVAPERVSEAGVQPQPSASTVPTVNQAAMLSSSAHAAALLASGQHAEAGHKRSRLGLVGISGVQPSGTNLQEGDECQGPAKRHISVKLGRGQTRRRGGVPRVRRPRSDWAGRANGRKKSTSDMQFEDTCLQIIGARVGVWWEDDEAYYKGEIISHDWYHKRLKIRYDDGIVETFSPLRDRFVWLTPRGVTAGATPDIVDAMRALGAANVISNNTQLCGGPRAERCSPFPLAIKRECSPSTAVVTPTEAAVSEAGTPNLAGRVVDSIRSMFGRPTSAASPVSLMATFGVVAQALNSQAIDPASAPVPQDEEPPVETQVADRAGQGSRGEATMGGSRFAMTPEPGEAPAPPQSAPQGHQATNWRISLVFPGNGEIFPGWVLCFDEAEGEYLVLYEDGESEWVDLNQERVSWHAGRFSSSRGRPAGLPEGVPVPQGLDAVGWRIAVYWEDDREFYHGEVVSYDALTGKHTVLYTDGEKQEEALGEEAVKWILPPHVKAVPSRRGRGRKRRALETESEEDEDDMEEDDRDEDEEDAEAGWMAKSSRNRRFASEEPEEGSQPRLGSVSIATPKQADIRRQVSRLGSLVCYPEDLARLRATDPASRSPSPLPPPAQGQGETVHAEQGPQPLLVRNAGFIRVPGEPFAYPVSRVRIFVSGAPPAQPASRLDLLVQMQQRVTAAEHSLSQGFQGTLSGPASPRQAGAAAISASPVGVKNDAGASGMAQRSGPPEAQKLGGATETDIAEDDEYGDDDAEDEGEEEEEVEESEDEDYKVGSRKGAPSPFARPSRLAAFPGLPHGRSLLSLACGPAHELLHSSSQGGEARSPSTGSRLDSLVPQSVDARIGKLGSSSGGMCGLEHRAAMRKILPKHESAGATRT